MNQYPFMMSEAATMILVRIGSSPSRSLKMSSKIGTRNISIPASTRNAKQRTRVG